MKPNRLLPLALLAAVLAPAGAASAQMKRTDVADLVPGSRTRVTVVAGRGQFEGTIRGVTGDTLWIWQEAGISTPVERGSVDRLEIYQGRHGNALPGALMGGGVILVAGLVTAATGAVDGDLSVLAGTVGGLLVGGLIGALIKSERWRSVDWNVGSSPRVVPAVRVLDGDLTLGLRITP